MKTQIVPPFTAASAKEKVQRAEDLWNKQDPKKISMAYSEDSEWRNRGLIFKGRKNIVSFLISKWQKENQYKLKKDLFSFTDNKIAVDFIYEYQSENSVWFRAYGNEHWEFNSDGLMTKRDASINDVAISVQDRMLR
ncbi:MAG: nuclear transport factor 2 (NTF2) superfamily protein [Candidatus Azotimanducaceae bacterium]|jgi:nuclear transport factor 2 (NTF2) superfamily protein